MNSENPETDIEVQSEDQKSKATNPMENSYLYENFRLKESNFRSHSDLYSSLVLGLKACITTTQSSWLNCVASGIKIVCYHYLASMGD